MPTMEEELESLPYYVGTMDGETAGEIIAQQPRGEKNRPRNTLQFPDVPDLFVGTYLLRLKESGEPRITHLTQAGKTVHVMVGRGGRPNQEAAASAEQGAEGYYVGSSTWAETLDGLIREFSEPGLKRYHFEKPYNGGGV